MGILIYFLSCLIVHHTTAYSTYKTFQLLDESNKPPDIQTLPDLVKSFRKPRITKDKKQYLLALLGSSYDPVFTSISEPSALRARDMSTNFTSEQVSSPQNKMKIVPTMTASLKNMDFVVNKKSLGKKSSAKFRRWLWNLSKCPVRYKWFDLGVNFFPRYIKKGHCSKKKTCSFPAGFKCREASYKTVAVLLYTCISSQNYVDASCKWRTMNLTVLDRCTCSCRT